MLSMNKNSQNLCFFIKLFFQYYLFSVLLRKKRAESSESQPDELQFDFPCFFFAFVTSALARFEICCLRRAPLDMATHPAISLFAAPWGHPLASQTSAFDQSSSSSLAWRPTLPFPSLQPPETSPGDSNLSI